MGWLEYQYLCKNKILNFYCRWLTFDAHRETIIKKKKEKENRDYTYMTDILCNIHIHSFFLLCYSAKYAREMDISLFDNFKSPPDPGARYGTYWPPFRCDTIYNSCYKFFNPIRIPAGIDWLIKSHWALWHLWFIIDTKFLGQILQFASMDLNFCTTVRMHACMHASAWVFQRIYIILQMKILSLPWNLAFEI